MDIKIFAQRLQRERISKNITQNKLSEISGVSQATISEYESGKVRTAPGADNVYSLAKALKVSYEYLLGVSNNKVIDIASGQFTFKNRFEYKMVPIIGAPADKQSESDNEIVAPSRLGLDLYYYCKDNKMFPTIYKDDLLGIKNLPEIRNGDIVLARIGNREPYLYRYFREDRIYLKLDNPAFDSLEFEAEEFKSKVHIIGVGVNVLRVLRTPTEVIEMNVRVKDNDEG